ncbi:MAG: AMP-binding protein [Anaerolineales bacterium]|nr:AMP-binding protein [Anaerolineales bacterium]
MTEQFTFGGEIVWRPSQAQIERAHLTAFMRKHHLADFDALMKKSTSDVAWFTESVLQFLDVQFYEPYSQVVDLSGGIQFPKWCAGGKMNVVYNCVEKRAVGEERDKTALIFEGEEGVVRSLTYAELNKEVNKTANALRALGLGKGDAIGLYMPMTAEIVIALLAIAKIGGVILPLFSGYGVGAIVSRLVDADAKALFVADGSFRRGKTAEMKSVADEAAQQVPTLKHMIVLQRSGQAVNMQAGRDHGWRELIDAQSEVCETERTSAEDALMIIYTSGTTGKPKGALHTHCGFPVKAAQDMAFGMDVHAGDVIYWMTDMGWMMGPWLVFGSLLLGATMFVYDGAPDFPTPARIWEMTERHKINQLGVSPTLIRALIPHGDEHFQKCDLSSLQCFGSTGEPWNPDPWMWLFEKVGGGKIPIINYSGGTEISGGIVMGNPILPLKPCAFSAPCPGMDADVVDDDGNSVRNAVGELVIKAPWIGMTRGFWRDKQRYLDAYWSRWENVWAHGDFAAIDKDGLWYILGRSDDTIKVAGKRLGPAEVESILVSHASVVEAAAIGVPHEIKGGELIVFVTLKPNVERSDALRRELREMVAAEMGKPLAPKDVFFVSDLPKTRNAKVMRRMIRSAYLGQALGDVSSLVNPQAVEEIQNLKSNEGTT